MTVSKEDQGSVWIHRNSGRRYVVDKVGAAELPDGQ